tara:strand:+ start:3205 stop:3687 length:483 start_codon:yes stop_codon:yes gene_type:complete
MKFNKKEVFWFFGVLLLTLVSSLAVFGFEALKTDAAFDINIHDSYFVFSNRPPTVAFILFIFFSIYFFRMLKGGFKNSTVNVIFIFTNILFVLALFKINSIVNVMSNIKIDSESYATLDKVSPVENLFNMFSNVLYVIQIIVLFLLAYSGFKAGRNYKAA